MSKTLPRRAVLGALALAPAAITVASVPALAAGPAAAMPDVHDLWRRALAARAQMHAAVARFDAAYDRLPWWVKPGLDCVDSEGQLCGSESREPAMQDLSPSQTHPSAKRLIRPDVAWFKKLLRGETLTFGHERATACFDERMAGLNERRAAAGREWEKLDLPTLIEAQNAMSDRSCERDDAIRALDPTQSLDVLAAHILTEAYYVCGQDEAAEDQEGLFMTAVALRGLLPQLTGDIAAAAAEVARNPQKRLKDFSYARGLRSAGLGCLSPEAATPS